MNNNTDKDVYNPLVCCVCESADFSVVVNGPVVKIVRCNKCGFMRQGEAVRQDPYSFMSYAGTKDRFKRQREEKERIQRRDFQPIIERLNQFFPGKGALLEVGCAMGTILNDFKESGWEVTGVEPEKWTCEEAKRRYGLDVKNTTFQDAGFTKESFDVILMLHVIEHLPDPYNGLQYLTELLKPGGIIVLETPRYDTFTFKLLKGRERSVIPGHLYYYTKNTLREQVERLRLEELSLESVGRTVTLDRLSFYAAKLFDTELTTKMITKTADLLRLNKKHLYINLGDMTRGYFRKPKGRSK